MVRILAPGGKGMAYKFAKDQFAKTHETWDTTIGRFSVGNAG